MAAEPGQPEKLTVAEILRIGAAQYVNGARQPVAPQVQSTLAKLSLCRTAALGGRRYQCVDCEESCLVYNSCGDRHCPTCSGSKRADWVDSSSALILEGIEYYQVVFTLPEQLSQLALGNRRAIYDLLFRSSWLALKETVESEQGYDPAALLVLHTWNQKLGAHAHVHALVPGAGPALDGSGLRRSQRAGDPSSVGRYLVDAGELRAAYRKKFMRGLKRLRSAGKLRLSGKFADLQCDDRWQEFLAELEAVDWVSYIQPPPTADCRAEQVVKYLSRYLTGGPISDARIISANEREVTFMARAGKKSGGESQQIPITLPIGEFVSRWSLHVLPKGYTKTRRFGGWSNTRRDAYLERCSILLEAASDDLPAAAVDFDPLAFEQDAEPICCPGCGSEMILQREVLQPSWPDVMASTDRPWWYHPWSHRKSLPPNPSKH